MCVCYRMCVFVCVVCVSLCFYLCVCFVFPVTPEVLGPFVYRIFQDPFRLPQDPLLVALWRTMKAAELKAAYAAAPGLCCTPWAPLQLRPGQSCN